MIVGYRDKRTADFAAGRRVKAFLGIDRAARLKLDRLEAALAHLFRMAGWIAGPDER
jgi:plasmid maintenance system killer protein